MGLRREEKMKISNDLLVEGPSDDALADEDKWDAGRITDDFKAAHSALSVISLLRADGPSNLALLCCSSSPSAYAHIQKTHTSVSRYKRSRSDGIFQILFLCAAHKQTRFHREKLKHSVTFQNKSACQCSVFVWQISLDMQHFQSYLKPEIPFHFLTV